VSQDQTKEVTEINRILAQAKSTIYATCGTATGLISDNVTGILVELGRIMVNDKQQISRLIKENEELKKNINITDKKK